MNNTCTCGHWARSIRVSSFGGLAPSSKTPNKALKMSHGEPSPPPSFAPSSLVPATFMLSLTTSIYQVYHSVWQFHPASLHQYILCPSSGRVQTSQYGLSGFTANTSNMCLPLTFSFLMLFILVTPKERLNIFISATSSLPCVFSFVLLSLHFTASLPPCSNHHLLHISLHSC